MNSTAVLLSLILTCCISSNKKEMQAQQPARNHVINCTDSGCTGTYNGPEFVNHSDVAHQFSNHMSRAVGNKLKELYDEKKYSKVNLSKITMSTTDMNHLGNVVYTLTIPFVNTADSCAAFTAFDHRGGWGHKLKKQRVLEVFKSKNKIEFVELNTPEGLQEFWIQWRHESKQALCK